MYYKLKVSKLMHNKFLVPYLIAGDVNIIALGKGNASKRNTGFITATVNGGILNPKIYSARPGDQCQAQQAVCSINQSVFSTLVWLPPPCGIVGLPFWTWVILHSSPLHLGSYTVPMESELVDIKSPWQQMEDVIHRITLSKGVIEECEGERLAIKLEVQTF